MELIVGPKSALPVLTAAGLLLSGCVTQQQIAVAPAANRPPPVAPSGPVTVKRTALAGQTTRIDFANSLNPDCSVRDIPTMRLTDRPLHGIAEIRETEDYPAFLPQNIHAVCNKQKVRGTAITYTPDKAYTGPDYFSFEIVYSDGTDRVIRIMATVK